MYRLATVNPHRGFQPEHVLLSVEGREEFKGAFAAYFVADVENCFRGYYGVFIDDDMQTRFSLAVGHREAIESRLGHPKFDLHASIEEVYGACGFEEHIACAIELAKKFKSSPYVVGFQWTHHEVREEWIFVPTMKYIWRIIEGRIK